MYHSAADCEADGDWARAHGANALALMLISTFGKDICTERNMFSGPLFYYVHSLMPWLTPFSYYHHVYRNLTTLRSDLCYRKSVCRLLSVTFVRPTQKVVTFGNISLPFCTLAIF